jgi:putative hemolysin
MTLRRNIVILFMVIAAMLGVIFTLGCIEQEEQKIANPAAVYCKGLGYEYKIIADSEGGQKGVCVFLDKSECDAWDFFTGKCGKEYTYCEMHGGKIITTTEGCSFSSECALCVLPNGTKINEWDYFRGGE